MDAPRAGATRFSQRLNSRIAYDPGSPPGMDDAPVVLLLHDLLADRGAFAAQRATLASAARVIVPDARGHGASATLRNQWYTVAELAMDAQAILDLERVLRVHVVGHGLGAAAALELARRAPERVATLTLIEPALYAVLDNDQDPAVAGLRSELRANDRAAADDAYKGQLDKALDTYVRPRWSAGWRERVPRPRLAAIRRHAAALAGLLPALDAYAPAKRELTAVATPTRVVTGVDAPPVAHAVANRLAALLPGANASTLPLGDRAHQPLAGGAAEAINRLLLAQLDGSGAR